MVNSVKAILNVSQAAQALALTKENLKLVKSKKKNSKGLVGTALKNIIGIELIKSQGKIIGSL